MNKVMVGIDSLAEQYRDQRDEVLKTVVDLNGLHSVEVAHLIRMTAYTLVRGSGIFKGGSELCKKVTARLCQLLYSVRMYDRELTHSFTTELVTLHNDFSYSRPHISESHQETTHHIKKNVFAGLVELRKARDELVHQALCETSDKISYIVSLTRPVIQRLLCEFSGQARGLDTSLLDTLQNDMTSLRSARNYFEFEVERL